MSESTNLYAERIIRIVADTTGIPVASICGRRRNLSSSRARYIAMRIMRDNTFMSPAEIGESLGGKDRTTVLHGLKAFDETCAAVPAFKSFYEKSIAALGWDAIANPRRDKIISNAPHIKAVIAAVSDATGEPTDVLLGHQKTQRAVLSRALCAVLIRETQGMSYPDIAVALNQGSHSTIIEHERRYKEKMGEGNDWMVGVDRAAREALGILAA